MVVENSSSPASPDSPSPIPDASARFNRRRFMQTGVLLGTAAAAGYLGTRVLRVTQAQTPGTAGPGSSAIPPGAMAATTAPGAAAPIRRTGRVPSTRKIRFTPVETYLGNPHQGCCTFQRFNGDPLNPGEEWSEEGPLTFPAPVVKRGPVEGYLPCTVSYCRWFWNVLEPEEGRYDFSMIDKSLDVCKERGQTLSVRLMAFGYVNQP